MCARGQGDNIFRLDTFHPCFLGGRLAMYSHTVMWAPRSHSECVCPVVYQCNYHATSVGRPYGYVKGSYDNGRHAGTKSAESRHTDKEDVQPRG